MDIGVMADCLGHTTDSIRESESLQEIREFVVFFETLAFLDTPTITKIQQKLRGFSLAQWGCPWGTRGTGFLR